MVGAGPAGPVAALGLARRSVGVRIVDRASAPPTGSRARAYSRGPLEVLESLGVVEEVLSCGGPFPRWRSYRGGRVAWEKSIYDLLGIAPPMHDPAIPYPETWMVPQWRTEQILRAALSGLGVEVEYGSTLAALDLDDDGVAATLDRPDQRETVRASYVVAADGAASTVRRLLEVSFDGITREDERFVVADVRTPDLDRVYWHNWAAPDDASARVSICPLPGTEDFQFVAPLSPGAIHIGSGRELNVFQVDGNVEAQRQTPMFGRGRIDHLGPQADSIESFDVIRERLLAARSTDGFVTDFGPVLSLFFVDPDGLEGEVCVGKPHAVPGQFNPPGTAAAGYERVL